MNLYFRRNYLIFIREYPFINNHLKKKTMLLFETIDRMDRIHQMIKRQATGSIDEFAGKINLKKRQLYYILDEFKDFGADIRFSRMNNSYYYRNDFEVKVIISVSPLSDAETKSVIGGGYCAIYLTALPHL